MINASFGGSSISTALADKWKLAHTNNIITVHAAGNDGGSNPLLGAQLPLHSGYEDLSSTLIAVVATNSSNTITWYSNKCGSAKNWCMAAPGDGIYSTVAVDDNNYASNYGTMSGTSMADPHVAGAAAVLRGKWPSKNAAQIVTILYDTATDLGAAGIDDIYGRGLLNLDNALFAQGVLTISTASGASYSLEESSIQVASNMGNSLNGLLGMSVFDKYKRDYSFDMNGVIHYASESGLVDELNYSDTNYSSAIDDLQLSVNLQDNSAKMTTQLNEVNVGFAHNTLYNSENISGFSKQYSLFDNAYLSQLKGSSSIQIAKDNATLELLSGYWDADNEQAIKEVGVSFLNDFNDDFYIKARLSYLEEDETFLSNYFSNAYKTGKAKTHALSLTSSLKPTANLNIIAQYSQGNTQVDSLSDSVIRDISLLKSQYYSATVLNKNVYFDNDALFFSLKHPLQITQGSLNLSLADGLNADDSISFVDRRIPITASALSNEMSLGYTANYAKNSQASVLLNRANVLGSSIQLENQLMLKMTKKF